VVKVKAGCIEGSSPIKMEVVTDLSLLQHREEEVSYPTPFVRTSIPSDSSADQQDEDHGRGRYEEMK